MVYNDVASANYQQRLAGLSIPLDRSERTAAQQAQADLEWWATIEAGRLRLQMIGQQGPLLSGDENP